MGMPLGLRFWRPVKALLLVAPPWWSWAKIFAPYMWTVSVSSSAALTL